MVATDDRALWLAELYDANASAVFGYCRRFLKNAEDAQDATHEVFIRAIPSLNAPPTSRHARAWLITVAQNYCLDLARRRRRMQTALTTLGAETHVDAGAEARFENRQLLQAVLAQLGERERQVLWQSAVERRPLAEIATGLGLSYMAAAQAVHRARKHASMVAANLAAILGWTVARVMRRRSLALNSAQTAAALAVVPLMAAVVVATAAVNHGSLSFTGQHRAKTTSSQVSSSGTAGATGQAESTAPGSHRRLVGRLVPQNVRDTLHSTLGRAATTVSHIVKSAPTPPAVPTALPVLPTPSAVPSLAPH